MRSIVVSALFEALPAAGYGCLRFNFRGVEGSAGSHGEGLSEPEDVRAALEEALTFALDGAVAVVGWSFGADMALSVADPRIDGWVGIAPPLRFGKRVRRGRRGPAAQTSGARAARRLPRPERSTTRGRVVDERHDRSRSGRQSLLHGAHRPGGRRDRCIPRDVVARLNR